MWIYKYLRTDHTWIEMGPYNSNGEANKAREDHESFGAKTVGPFEMPDDHKLPVYDEED